MIHGIKIYFHEGYMMDSQQGNVLPEESRLSMHGTTNYLRTSYVLDYCQLLCNVQVLKGH